MRIIILFFVLFLFANSAYCNPYNVNIDFFKKFNDEFLISYILKALENNHTLKEADYRVERYRWETKKSLSYELPELSTLPGYLGVHFPKNDYNIFLKNNAFILPLKVNFEPDFLLKNRDKTRKAKSLYNAEIAKTKSTYISLLSDVAGAYINILLFDYLIKKQAEIIENNTGIADKEKLKYVLGLNNKEQLNKAQESLKIDEIDFVDMVKKRKTTLFNFCNLIGESADNFEDIKRGDIENFEYTESIPEIISSDLIYKRPDIIEMENKLKSAKIDINIAKKEFFPKFDITGLLVFDTLGIGNFFSWNSSFAFLIANAAQDIFQGGRKIANLKIKKSKFNELMEEYRELDLTAIKEINNALNLIKQDKTNESNRYSQLKLEEDNFNMSEKKLNSGVISNLDYLNYKNDYLKKEQLFITSKAERIVDYITLYKAIGGEL